MYKTARSPFLESNWGDTLQVEYLTLFVNNICNAKCSYCIMEDDEYNNRNTSKHEMSLDTLRGLLEKIKDTSIRHVRLVGKEPLLWTHLQEGIKMIREEYGLRLTIISNGIARKDIKPDALILHIDKEFLDKDPGKMEYWFQLKQKNNFRLILGCVLNGESTHQDINYFYKNILRYADDCTLFCETPILFQNKRSKIAINKTIYLYRALYDAGFKSISFEHPFPYCLIHPKNMEFLEKNHIVFGGTCHAGKDFIIDYDGKTSYPCIGLLKKKYSISEKPLPDSWSLYSKDLSDLRHRMPKEECYDCEWYKNNLCHGGCLVNRYSPGFKTLSHPQ